MTAYYNEIEPFAADWLRGLIAAGLIPAGDVDDRSIADVRPDDLAGYDQCHFFAGIGGWPLALRFAGWPGGRPVWTGSCPCQPFSAAGQGRGGDDARHLWPEFTRLIRERRPAIVFGEQVASPDALVWLDVVSADLEAEGYAVGAADLCAAGLGAPHIRQRLFWVADAVRAGRDERRPEPGEGQAARGGSTGGMGDPHLSGLEGPGFDRDGPDERFSGSASVAGRAWDGAGWIECSDGKRRAVGPGVYPLAHGVPGRVGRLRAYGNAIVPQVAAEFVAAFMEAIAVPSR